MSLRVATPRRLAAAGVALLAAVALTAASCSSDDDATPRSSSTVTTTSVPTPSTVSDADFESQATTAELMIRNAGNDPCAVLKAFAPASSLPSPINPTQTERGVRVIVLLFDTAAASAPPDAAADAAVLRQAGAALAAEGAAAGWAPNWLMQNPKALTTPEFIQAFTNYQSAVGASCGPTTPSTSPSTTAP